MSIIRDSIRNIPDFPKKGIEFKDISTLLTNPEAFHLSLDLMLRHYQDKKIEAIVGIEARGFVFASALAYLLKVPFVMARKKGKLPAKTISTEYDLEYGHETMEMHADALKPGQRVLIMDDLLATGGTCRAAIRLVEMLQAEVVGCSFIVDLPDLKGSQTLRESGYSVFCLEHFDGH